MLPLHPVKSDFLKDTDALVASDTIFSGLLLAGAEQTITVPVDAAFVIFTAESNFYANYDLTASIPTGTISQAGGELNPDIRFIGDTTSINLIAPSNTKISAVFYGK